MVPALIVVKGMDLLGVTDWLGWALSPFMAAMGLPDEMALVWGTAILTNIYTGMVVFYDLMQGQTLTAAQVTTVATLMLLAHAIPVEGAVAKVAGVPWWITILLRVGGSFVLGVIIFWSYRIFDYQQQDAQMIWQPQPGSDSLVNWALDQVTMLFFIFWIIAGLMLMLRILRVLGIEKLMHWLLEPVLRVLKIGKEATNVTIVGVTLGLSFGAGLLISEIKAGHINKRDVFLSICFLGLCHSLIEDTLLVMLLGADVVGVLWGRLIFALIVIAILARLLSARSLENLMPIKR